MSSGSNHDKKCSEGEYLKQRILCTEQFFTVWASEVFIALVTVQGIEIPSRIVAIVTFDRFFNNSTSSHLDNSQATLVNPQKGRERNRDRLAFEARMLRNVLNHVTIQ